jgi:uncharacterized protein (DUF169 family)
LKRNEIMVQLERSEQKAQCFMKLAEALELDGSPVAVAITPEVPMGMAPISFRATACIMVQIARRGDAFYSSWKDILCGGRANLGMGESPIRKLDDFLVRREKLFGSKAAADELIDSATIKAPNRGKYLAFAPLEKASFTPDVVLFVGTPLQVSRIIFLNAFQTGLIDTLHGEPLCSGAIAAPITSGKIGVSFLDMACRSFGRYRPEEMVIGVPYNRLSHILDSLDASSAGTAKPSAFLRIAGSWLRRRAPDNSSIQYCSGKE